MREPEIVGVSVAVCVGEVVVVGEMVMEFVHVALIV